MGIVDSLRSVLIKDRVGFVKSGRVESVDGTTAVVVVDGKSKTFVLPDSDITTYKRGDTVTVQDGKILGRKRVGKTKIVYV
jgi:hypothetical protein